MPQRAAVHLFGEAVDVTAMLGRFDGAGEQCQDSAVEVAGLPVRLVQGAVDPAEVVPVGVAPCGGLFPVADGVRAAGGATRCAGGSGDCGSSGVCASTRCVTPGPSVLPRVRWDNECGDSGRGSIARCPRGSIGGSSGTSSMPWGRGRRLRHRCGAARSTGGARSIACGRTGNGRWPRRRCAAGCPDSTKCTLLRWTDTRPIGAGAPNPVWDQQEPPDRAAAHPADGADAQR